MKVHLEVLESIYSTLHIRWKSVQHSITQHDHISLSLLTTPLSLDLLLLCGVDKLGNLAREGRHGVGVLQELLQIAPINLLLSLLSAHSWE